MATKKKPAAKVATAAAPKNKSRPTPKRSRGAVEAQQGVALPELGELTPKQAAFVREYLVDLNATQAAIRAGYSPDSAYAISSALLKNHEVAAAIAQGQGDRAQRTQVQADDVLHRLWLLATADPRELTEHVVDACRHCWGPDHKRQRTPAELERERRRHAALVAREEASGAFDEEGGAGFDPRRGPHQECPECHGRGESRTILKDTRRLSPGAAMLFAGVKQTKDGIEVKTHSAPDSLVNVGKHLGMFLEKVILGGKLNVQHDATAELREFIRSRNSPLPIGPRGG